MKFPEWELHSIEAKSLFGVGWGGVGVLIFFVTAQNSFLIGGVNP